MALWLLNNCHPRPVKAYEAYVDSLPTYGRRAQLAGSLQRLQHDAQALVLDRSAIANLGTRQHRAVGQKIKDSLLEPASPFRPERGHDVWGGRAAVPFPHTLWGTGNGLPRALPAPRWGSARTIRHLGPSRSSRVRCTGTGSAPIGAFLCSFRGLRQREIRSWLDAPIDQERRRRIFCG